LQSINEVTTEIGHGISLLLINFSFSDMERSIMLKKEGIGGEK